MDKGTYNGTYSLNINNQMIRQEERKHQYINKDDTCENI
jgi:hypothetical protein